MQNMGVLVLLPALVASSSQGSLLAHQGLCWERCLSVMEMGMSSQLITTRAASRTENTSTAKRVIDGEECLLELSLTFCTCVTCYI